MKVVLAVAGVLLLAAAVLVVSPPVPAQDAASQIVGVWKLKTFERCKAGTNECTAFFGENPVGYLVYTKGGRFFSQIFNEKRPAPKGPNPSDEERILLHKSMVAWGGPYVVKDQAIIVNIEFSWNQSWTGTERQDGTFKI